MFIAGNFIAAIAGVLSMIINIAWWLIIIRALISWVNPDPNNPIVQFLYGATEPMLYPFRRLMQRIIPGYGIGLDLSPILAILTLFFIRQFLVATLFDLSRVLR
ncbi:MAG: YggT family protein [Candidatus Omnitrophica bacterium]|nr:YggT family protein [Candidatus Omnitrophota bacterium]